MSNSKWIAFVTPKAYSKLDLSKIPEHMANDIEIVATADIYMNMLDPEWTEERCDDTLYIVERKHFEWNKTISFKLKDN
jgi:hypothetical protein